VVKPLGDARPAWKVLRVLGNLLGLPGFEFDSSEEVKAAALSDLNTVPARLSNKPADGAPVQAQTVNGALERLADVPIYSADALVRRASALQETADARAPQASLPPALWAQLGLDGALQAKVKVSQGGAAVVLSAKLDATLPANVVRVPAGHADTAALGAQFGVLTVERV
jgi:NADH-quinone oxidoreductase subunit G